MRPGYLSPPAFGILAAIILILLAGVAGCDNRLPPSPDQPLPLAATPRQPNPDLAPVPACTGNPPLVTDTLIRQAPALAEPAARVPFQDPVFGSCLVRVTDRKQDTAAGDGSKGLKNEYSRVSAFNADESRILIRGTEGTWYLYDAATLAPLGRLPLEMDPRWDAGNPDLVYFIDGPLLQEYSLSRQDVRTVHDFAPDFPGIPLSAVWTRYEGSPSADGRYWGLMAQDTASAAVALLVYDQREDRILARRDLRGVVTEAPDSVTISPLGTYVVVQDEYCEPGTLGTFQKPCGLMVYPRNLTSARGLLRIIGHSDLTLDRNNREVLVYQDLDTDMISVLDLASGTITPLFPIDFSHTALGFHFSGRAFRHPGWVVVSTHAGGHPAAFTWMDDQVFAAELQKGGRVIRLAHTRSVVREGAEQDYWAEPQATTNRDMTRILFTSNWGRSGTDEVDTYLIRLTAP